MTSDTIKPGRRGRPPKSDFYHARWTKCMIGVKLASEVLGVSVEQIEEWDIVGNELAAKYLLLWDCKTVRVEGWEGFTFSRGVLKYKGRDQWTPDGLKIERNIGSVTRKPIYSASLIDLKTDFRELRK